MRAICAALSFLFAFVVLAQPGVMAVDFVLVIGSSR